MAPESTGVIEPPKHYDRILGSQRGAQPGPTVIAMTGIHGNEKAGVEAGLRVLAWIAEHRPPIRGAVTVLAGNLTALALHRRYVDIDLNRAWTPEKMRTLAEQSPRDDEPAEAAEQRELLAILGRAVEDARGPLVFLDLHTSSADGPPFLTIGDTLRNRRFARSFPLPLILGLEEQVDGALLELLNNYGFITVGVEAGRHEAADSVDRHEAVLWHALVAAGSIAAEDAPDLAPYRRLLERTSEFVPHVIEVRYRHPISATDLFRMEPGYKNFQRVSKGEMLARDRNGPVRCPEDGLILLPLYQGQGEDGFFLAREFRPFWWRLSRVARKLRLGRWVHLLPGVRRDPDDPEQLIVDTKVARFYPLEIFHLLGFRKRRQDGSVMRVSRRRYDQKAPSKISFV